MLKLKAHLLTQGMHGMVSQVEGLAKGLNLNFKHHTVKLKYFWNFIPPKLTPVNRKIYLRLQSIDILWMEKCNSLNSIKEKI